MSKPRALLEPGSPEWAEQTLFWLEFQRKNYAEYHERFGNDWAEAAEHELWKLVPPGKPFGTAEALLAHLGINPQTLGIQCGEPAATTQGCNAQWGVTRGELARVLRVYNGSRSDFAYAAFDWINCELFDSRLPLPLIVWAITPYGGCLGKTGSDPERTRPPVVTLHPGLLGGRSKETPWGVPAALLGPAYAFEVLIHECIHIAVNYLLGGAKGPTSHDNPQWIGEVERIAPLLGIEGLRPARNRPKRVRLEDGRSVVRRVCDGNVSFKALARFPHAVRRELGLLDVYEKDKLPFPWEW